MLKHITLLLFFIYIYYYYFYCSIVEPYNTMREKTNINSCYANCMSIEEHAILTKLINIWKDVSEKLDIKWSVCGGSYIGAMREKGRILWDDDFDITILKKDVSKMKNIDKILDKYNVSITTFWGGYKIYFNNSDNIKSFKNYKWKWPFIDIFAIEKDKECAFLQESEFPLKEMIFNDTSVFVYENPSNTRSTVKNKKWKTEYYDQGYRHQLEHMIGKRRNWKKCKPIKIK